MKIRYHDSFQSLIAALHPEGLPTFIYEQYDENGKIQEIELPKYLFRGEPNVYSNTFTSLKRAEYNNDLSKKDLGILYGVLNLAKQYFGLSMGGDERLVLRPISSAYIVGNLKSANTTSQ